MSNFDAHICRDNEELPLGDVKLTVIHTPGHTMESTCFLLHDEAGAPTSIFTGDTLFIGDAGRPDLAQKSASMTQESLAGMLYHSLRERIMPLPDHVVVFPGHGAGSACGKNMSKETKDTLGNQKLTNYTLRRDATEEEFVKELLNGLRPPPGYFSSEVALNKGVAPHEDFTTVVEHGMKPLSVAEFKALTGSGLLILDTRRTPEEFCAGFIPMSVFAGTSGALAVWIATVFSDVSQPFVVVADAATLSEGIARLARVGFDHCLGHLESGVDAWAAAGEPLETLQSLTADEYAKMLEEAPGKVQTVDVRGPGEYRNDHIADAHSVPLCSREPIDFHKVPADDEDVLTCIHCARGYRSVMFLSLMRRAGVTAKSLTNITGGWTDMMEVASLRAKTTSRQISLCANASPRATNAPSCG
jgi:hydroxyacylglutathione hydrolase